MRLGAVSFVTQELGDAHSADDALRLHEVATQILYDLFLNARATHTLPTWPPLPSPAPPLPPTLYPQPARALLPTILVRARAALYPSKPARVWGTNSAHATRVPQW
mgnify:CR=1 FL=1